MTSPKFRLLTWTSGSASDVRTGLLGYLSIEYGALVLDGIVLRRTAEGRLSLSFPARTDRAGRRHSYVRPIDDHTRRQIEAEVLRALGEQEGAIQ